MSATNFWKLAFLASARSIAYPPSVNSTNATGFIQQKIVGAFLDASSVLKISDESVPDPKENNLTVSPVSSSYASTQACIASAFSPFVLKM